MDILVPVILGLGLFAVLRYVPRMMSGAQYIDTTTFKEAMRQGGDVLVIDVRTEREFATGHVPGALNLPVGDIKNRLKELGEQLEGHKEIPVYLVCRTDNRATSAARTLKKAGFSDIKVLSGGMGAWNRAGYPSA
ncbi:MAG: rhodanese-like domain-containing protein [Magnetospiraceae bacterium]